MINLLLNLVAQTSLTISPIGLTIHSPQAVSGKTEIMKNQLTKNGILALNPQFSLKLNHNNWIYSLTYLKDCFDNHAGSALIGREFRMSRYFSFGVLAGLYAREPQQQTWTKNGLEYQMKLPLSYRSNDVEVAPFIFGTAAFTFPVTTNAGIEINIGSNVFLTHIQLGVKFGF